MVPTVVMIAALVAAYDPVSEVPLYKTPGPTLRIPCKVDGTAAVERVQLYVSDNRGKTWTLYEEIAPDQTAFTFQARKPGEYWFTARLKKRDGTLDPADPADFVVMQRVAVETGSGAEPLLKPTAEIAGELDDELTRLELELIRKEIKRLSEEGRLTPDAEERIDRLRNRLRDARDRLRSRDPLRATPPLAGPQWIPDNRLIPPTTTAPPVVPTAPARVPPEAPQPRVPERP
jgi:hypothetical protein